MKLNPFSTPCKQVGPPLWDVIWRLILRQSTRQYGNRLTGK